MKKLSERDWLILEEEEQVLPPIHHESLGPLHMYVAVDKDTDECWVLIRADDENQGKQIQKTLEDEMNSFEEGNRPTILGEVIKTKTGETIHWFGWDRDDLDRCMIQEQHRCYERAMSVL